MSLEYPDIDLSYKPAEMSYATWFKFVSDGDWTELLRVGIEYRKINLVKLAVAKGARVNRPYLLTLAVEQGSYEIVDFLIRAKADINDVDGSSLGAAAKHGRADLIWLLVKNGADVNLGHGLVEAAQTGHFHIVQLLVENGAYMKMAAALIERIAMAISVLRIF